MTNYLLIVLVILVCTAVLFVSNRIRSDLVAILVLLSLMLTGVLTPPEALAGFSNPVVMIIISMFIVSEAIINTGIAQRVGQITINYGGDNEAKLVSLLMIGVGGLGAFLSSSAAITIFLPIALSVARKAGLNRKRLFMPLSIGALISGMMSLISTTPNLIVNAELIEMGFESLGFFSFTPFGLVILAVGILYVLAAGRKMLSKDLKSLSRKERHTAYDIFERYGLDKKVHFLRVRSDSLYVGRAVVQTQIKQHYEIHIIAFDKHRNGKWIPEQASPETVFEPNDEILVVGNRNKVSRIAENENLDLLPLSLPHPNERKRQEFFHKVGLAEIMLVQDSKLIGKTIRELDFQARYKATVVALRRRGQALTDNIESLQLDFGDALLINAKWPDIMSLRDVRENFVVLTIPEEYHEIAPARERAPLALTILGGMVVIMATGILPTFMAAMMAAIALIGARCVTLNVIYRVINWQVVVLVAGILPLATALNKSGAALLASELLIKILGGLGPLGMLAIVYLFTAATGLFISNTVTAILITPIAVDAAVAMDVSPHAFAITVSIACSAAFVTPISSPVNTVVMEPGGYRFMDYFKVGMPMLFLSLIVTMVFAWVMYLK